MFSYGNCNCKCSKTLNSFNVISESEGYRKNWLQPIHIMKGMYYKIVPRKENVPFGRQSEWTDQSLLELSETDK
jgi:hypothetical protein